MHNDGLSLFQVKNHLYQYDNVKVSGEAIRLWTKKYLEFPTFAFKDTFYRR